MNIKNIKTFTTFFLASVISFSPVIANPKLEQAILKQIIQNTEVTAQEIKDANVAKCFSVQLYTTKIKHTDDNGISTTSFLYIMKDDAVFNNTAPRTSKEMPELHSIVNPEFRLKTKEDGEHLIKAMKVIFKKNFDGEYDGQNEPHFVQNGTTWTMVNYTFGKTFYGFTFETNADGKITKISRSIQF
jgi:hypothetical protein